MNGDFERTLSTHTGHYHSLLTVSGMKEKRLLIGLLVLGSFLFFHALPIRGQNPPKTLTLAYSNNINAEIDPCPT